jgi:hypothetical protein
MNTGDILVPERLKPSRVLAKQGENGGGNLPAISGSVAKSFRAVSGTAWGDWQLR